MDANFLNIIKRITARLIGRNNKENKMNEKTISTINELFAAINEYGDKGFYFRGENKDYGKTACLPAFLRNTGHHKDAIENEWIKQKLEELGAGTPYTPPAGDNSEDIINNFFANSFYWSFFKWGEDKFEALMKHYTPDFKTLDEITGKNNAEYYSRSFSSAYLDITSDIMVALHFVCSVYHFLLEGENIESLQSENSSDGFLYVFDLKGIEKSELLKLISYPSYSYICKEKTGDKIYFQSFDRITNQRGAFLAPKRKKDCDKYIIDYEEPRKEIEKYTLAKIIITSALKKELYDIFGKEWGLEYYFPKIPCIFSDENSEIQNAYKKLKVIALLEKKE